MQENYGSNFQGVSFKGNAFLDEIVKHCDIVSCVTNSEVALVKDEKLKVGALLDLVDSFKHLIKECDNEAIKRGRVLMDNEATVVGAGELVGAFERGVIKKEDIVENLLELAIGDKVERTNSEEITLFKFVGSIVVDMLAA